MLQLMPKALQIYVLEPVFLTGVKLAESHGPEKKQQDSPSTWIHKLYVKIK